MRIAIVQKGRARVGKTTSIRLFYDMLLAKYPASTVTEWKGRGKDFRAIVTIGNHRIGVESLGDPSNPRPDDSFRLFAEQQCVAIVCASRTSGRTVERVMALAVHGYRIDWQVRESVEPREMAAANQLAATHILEQVQAVMGEPSA